MLLFVDADTLVPAAPLQEALDAIERGAVAGGAMVVFDGPVPLYGRVLLKSVIWLFRVFNFCGGCFLFCRRDAFEAVGGFDEVEDFIGRPVELMVSWGLVVQEAPGDPASTRIIPGFTRMPRR